MIEKLRAILYEISTWIVIACIAGMTIFFVEQSNTNSVQAAHQATDHAAITAQRVLDNRLAKSYVQGCERLVVINVAANDSNYADYILLKAAITDTEHVYHRKLKATNPLVQAERAQSWIPITNCRVVVAKAGSKYRLHQPVKFINQLPPHSALIVPPPSTKP